MKIKADKKKLFEYVATQLRAFEMEQLVGEYIGIHNVRDFKRELRHFKVGHFKCFFWYLGHFFATLKIHKDNDVYTAKYTWKELYDTYLELTRISVSWLMYANPHLTEGELNEKMGKAEASSFFYNDKFDVTKDPEYFKSVIRTLVSDGENA